MSHWPRKIAPFLLLAALAGCGSDAPPQDRATIYRNVSHGFSLTAPPALSIREYTPESLSIGQRLPESGFEAVADVRIYDAAKDAPHASFDAFALEALRNACAADGPDETIYCTQPQQRQPFRSESGLEGEVLYIQRIHETFSTGETTEDGFGPIFLFDISAANGDAEPSALVVQPPANLPAAEVDSVLLREVASSLSVTPTKQSD